MQQRVWNEGNWNDKKEIRKEKREKEKREKTIEERDVFNSKSKKSFGRLGNHMVYISLSFSGLE